VEADGYKSDVRRKICRCSVELGGWENGMVWVKVNSKGVEWIERVRMWMGWGWGLVGVRGGRQRRERRKTSRQSKQP
jgi:hypothetical protein